LLNNCLAGIEKKALDFYSYCPKKKTTRKIEKVESGFYIFFVDKHSTWDGWPMGYLGPSHMSNPFAYWYDICTRKTKQKKIRKKVVYASKILFYMGFLVFFSFFGGGL